MIDIIPVFNKAFDFKNWLYECSLKEMATTEFGKFKGQDHTQLPDHYLKWMRDKILSGEGNFRFAGVTGKQQQLDLINAELEKRHGTAQPQDRPQDRPQQGPSQVQQVRKIQPTQSTRNYIYATAKKDILGLKTGMHLAVRRIDNEKWEFNVLDSTINYDNPEDINNNSGELPNMGIQNFIQSVKAGDGQPIQAGSIKELLKKLQDLGAIAKEGEIQDDIPEKQVVDDVVSSKLIPENMISNEQRGIIQRFGTTFNAQEQSHIMIRADAGTGKTTVLKHLAWQYGKPGQKWLYLVFNTKNRVEAKEKFPTWVEVHTTNSFLGSDKVLESPRNKQKVKSMDRIATVSQGENKGKVEKIRLIADGSAFVNKMDSNWGVPKDFDYSYIVSYYDKVPAKVAKTLLNSIRYYFKAGALKLADLGKSFALDPRNTESLRSGLENILKSYDVDTYMDDVKEKISKYRGSFGDTMAEVLSEIMGYDFMSKNYESEMIDAAIWLLQVTMPGANYSQKWDKGSKSHNLGDLRDFKDDLWFSAIHANDLIWPKYNVVLADEVQDFNQCHKIVLRKLHEAGAKIVAVGDSKQSIYRFNGADSKAFENLATMLTGLSHDSTQVVHDLTLNFRSQPEVLEFAKYECNFDTDGKPFLMPGRKKEDFAQEARTSKYEIEYDQAFDQIGKEQKSGNLQQTAFISRTNAPLVNAALNCLTKGVPFVILGKDVAGDLIKHVKKITIMNRFKETDEVGELHSSMSGYFEKESDTHASSAAKRGYLTELNEITNAIIASIQKFEEEKDATGGSIKQFQVWIGQKLGGLEVQDSEKDLKAYRKKVEEENPVILTTSHKSKGLEFSRVFILRYDHFPHPKATREEDLEQEENAKYVSLTRAMNEVHILALDGQPGYEKKGE